jgi:predicted metal-dependent phosphoesterase TrpH
VAVSYEDVLAAAEVPPQCLGRPHLARALVNRGQVRTIGEAFERFIGNDSPCYVPADLITPTRAIDLVHDAGGLAVWAHPRLEVFDREVRQLRGHGLDGVECYRPRALPTEIQYYETAARDLGMLRTGGSDWHGSWHGPIGEFAIGENEIGAFLDRVR